MGREAAWRRRQHGEEAAWEEEAARDGYEIELIKFGFQVALGFGGGGVEVR